MPINLENGVLSWVPEEELDWKTRNQARLTASMPFVEGHVALMPDAHLGKGATIGSVIPTRGAIMPSAVGVDIGCGVVAALTNLDASDLPDDLGTFHKHLYDRVPAGLGKSMDLPNPRFDPWLRRDDREEIFLGLTPKDARKASHQFGTLGSGNHFLELCLDEYWRVWIVLHSGSRGVGNRLAVQHIAKAKGEMKRLFVNLDDPDLAYFVEGTPEFQAYIDHMLWAQDYAEANRTEMVRATRILMYELLDREVTVTQMINNHHNYATMEHHRGKNVWVTRKGAIRAREGDLGVIPGSMGTWNYIVEGLGSQSSWQSASHGAGRKMSRTQARKTFDAHNLAEQMDGRYWNRDDAEKLVDEHPGAYKDIEQVMEWQNDLVRPVHRLTTILNYKGA